MKTVEIITKTQMAMEWKFFLAVMSGVRESFSPCVALRKRTVNRDFYMDL